MPIVVDEQGRVYDVPESIFDQLTAYLIHSGETHSPLGFGPEEVEAQSAETIDPLADARMRYMRGVLRLTGNEWLTAAAVLGVDESELVRCMDMVGRAGTEDTGGGRSRRGEHGND